MVESSMDGRRQRGRGEGEGGDAGCIRRCWRGCAGVNTIETKGGVIGGVGFWFNGESEFMVITREIDQQVKSECRSNRKERIIIVDRHDSYGVGVRTVRE